MTRTTNSTTPTAYAVHFTQLTSSAPQNQTPWFMRRILSEASALEPTRFEYVWWTSAKLLASIGGAAPSAIRAHLSQSPLVLLPARCAPLILPTSRAQASLVMAMGVGIQDDATVILSSLGRLRLADPRPKGKPSSSSMLPGAHWRKSRWCWTASPP